MLVGKPHIFPTALRKPLAGEGVREERQVGPAPTANRTVVTFLDVVGTMLPPKNSFHREVLLRREMRSKKDSQGWPQGSEQKAGFPKITSCVGDFTQDSFQSSHAVYSETL